MKKILLILPIVMLLTAACQSASNTTTNNQTGTSTNVTQMNVAPQKFSDSTDYQSAVLISSDTLSAGAQQSLSGYSLTRQVMIDGTIEINLKATQSGYKDRQYKLQPGQQLYFVDRSLGDDASLEGNTRDDYGIIVDSQGYIVSAGL